MWIITRTYDEGIGRNRNGIHFVTAFENKPTLKQLKLIIPKFNSYTSVKSYIRQLRRMLVTGKFQRINGDRFWLTKIKSGDMFSTDGSDYPYDMKLKFNINDLFIF